MGQAQLTAVFKLINSPENKKVLDDNKNDIQRSVSGLAKDIQKSIGGDIFKGASASFIKNNPDIFVAAKDSGMKFAEEFSRGMKTSKSPFGGGADLAKVMGLPDINDLTRGTIKGLRDVTGKDLAKVMGLGDINDIGKFKGSPPPLIADVERERLKKMGLGIITAMFNPWIGSRLLSDAVNTGGGGGKGGSVAKGIFGAGGAFGFSEFYIAITAIKKSLQLLGDVLKWGANQLKKAIEFSHDLFAKSLESGLNLRFTALRQMTASTLGVNEKDIFRFAQSAMVMSQLSGAANELAKNAPQLAYTAAQFKILEFNLLALSSKVATQLTPALNGFATVLEKLINVLSGGKLTKILEMEFAIMFPKLAATIKAGGGILAAIGASGSGGQNSLGQPQTFMKQLPVGAFEKMGLIIGGGMADKALEYQRRTATAVEKLVGAAQGKNQKGSGYYMNRNPYVAGY